VGPLKLLRRLLLLGLILLVIALVVIDNLARVGSQDAVASAVKSSTKSQGASAKINSFPFIYDAAAEGKLGKVVITDRGVPIGVIRLDLVTLDARDVRFDRHQLFVDHKVHITGIDRATITMQTHLGALVSDIANSLNVQVTSSGPGIIDITAGGQTVSSIDLTKIPIVPACPLQITHTADEYTFTCTVSPVPPSVLGALSKVHPKV
jgi:hypothetical protein